MAKTIYQRIALEGGEAIAKQLRALGKDGEAAFVEIAAAAKKLQGDLGRLGGSFKDLGNSLATVGKRLGVIGGAAAGAAGGAVALVKSAGDAAKEIERLSQVSNATPAAFQQWAYAAQTVGIEQDKLADILKDTNDRVGDFLTTGGGPMKDFFENVAPLVGVTADQFAKLSGPEALQLYVSSLEKAGLGQQELTFYMEALASDATLLLPLLRGNGQEMSRLGREASALGAVMGGNAIGALSEADAALRKTFTAVGSLRNQLAALTAPLVTAGANALTAWLAKNNAAIRDFAFNTLTKATAIFRDFINAAMGNDAAVENQFILIARDAVLAFANTVQASVTGIIIPAYDALVAAAEKVAVAVNGIFGTDFTGQQLLVAAAVAKFVGLFGVLSASIGVVTSAFAALGSAWGLLVAAGGVIAPIFSAIASAAGTAAAGLAAIVGLPALIVAGVVAAGVAIFVFWEEIVAGAKFAWDAISSGAAAVWDGITAGVAAAWAAISNTFSGVGRTFGEWGTAAARFFVGGLSQITALMAQVWDALKRGGTIAAQAIGQGWQVLTGIFQRVWDGITRGASAAWSFLRDGFGALADWIGDLFDGVVSRIISAWNKVKSLASSATSAAKSIFDDPEPMGGAPGYATGGYVRGAGTGTSDSIAAWLSNGEFVNRNKSVRYYGADFFNALNQMRIPRDQLFAALRGMPRFSVGGLVQGITSGMSLSMPRFADGGLVAVPAGGGRPVNLTIDGRTFSGLTATDEAAEQIARYATGRRLKSAGRKPSWVGA